MLNLISIKNRSNAFTCFLTITLTTLFNISFAQVLENEKEFLLFTQPKTGTYLVGPLLSRLSEKKLHFAESTDFPAYPEPAKTEAEYNNFLTLDGHIPIFMHHLTIQKQWYVNLLNKLKKNHQFYTCHTPYSLELDKLLELRNSIGFFILRDPRDYIVSGARFYGTTDQCLFPLEWYQSLSFEEQVTIMIKGTDWYNSARWSVSNFKGWVSSCNCHVIHFEALIGAQGKEKQLNELKAIAEQLNLQLSEDKILAIFQEVFGTGPTFSGKKETWKEIFTEEHKSLCKEQIGDFLIELGYEKDYNW